VFKFAIVSRDHQIYKELMHKHAQETFPSSLQEVECIFIGAQRADIVEAQADIVLSEPDLADTFIAHCNKLKWLQSTWAGNNVLQKNDKRDYILTGTKGIFSAQMREYVFAYMLHLQREIEQFEHLKHNRSWQQPPIATLSGARLGIIGLGNIGSEIAKTAQDFDMEVSAITMSHRPIANIDYFSLSELTTFAHDCDYIVNLLPETQDTVGICDFRFFEAMKDSAVFINAGRGSVIKDDAMLVSALQNKCIRAAVLDVFKQEPLPAEHPFYKTENCYITNHTAAVSRPKQVFEVFTNNLERFVRNESLQFQHDFEKGY
jgi:phosphoglycerate dehydrogenase-like enzyme